LYVRLCLCVFRAAVGRGRQDAARIACQTFSGVAGNSTAGAPIAASALLTAFMTAGMAPIVPASPTPLTPSGFLSVGL